MLNKNMPLILLLWLWICPTQALATLLSIDESTTTPLNLTPWLMVSHPTPAKELAEIQALPKTDWHNFTNKDIQKLSGHDFGSVSA